MDSPKCNFPFPQLPAAQVSMYRLWPECCSWQPDSIMMLFFSRMPLEDHFTLASPTRLHGSLVLIYASAAELHLKWRENIQCKQSEINGRKEWLE